MKKIRNLPRNLLFLLGHAIGILALFGFLLYIVGPETPYSNIFGLIAHIWIFWVTFQFIKKQDFAKLDFIGELQQGNTAVAWFFGLLAIALAIIYTGL